MLSFSVRSALSRYACSLQWSCGRNGMRAFATTAARLSSDDTAWTKEWMQATAELRSDIPYEESAQRLRQLMRTGLLSLRDLQDNPERFFSAHRMLARHAVKHGPGFFIRFTVHYNLFAGSILAVGGPEQVASLDTMLTDGTIGCFGLTEKLAGVQSGLIVQTRADWDSKKRCFTINSPTEGSCKNWISQGLTADKAVVLVDLFEDGQPRGPHALLMDLRVGGKVVDGVELGCMGRKTVGNDLDNAWIRYTNVEVPQSALLNRYCFINDKGKYEQRLKGVPPFAMIGQRLWTGRVAVAQAALAYRRTLYDVTKAYSDNKMCWSPKGEVPLSDIPQLSALYSEAETTANDLEKFVSKCEAELCVHLRNSSLPPDSLVEAIATAKVLCVENSIDLCFRLKQEVGSFALMGDAGFEHMDFLQACKFAEGDSRILMLKVARDRVKRYFKGDTINGGTTELELCATMSEKKGDWNTPFKLANEVMQRTKKEFLNSSN